MDKEAVNSSSDDVLRKLGLLAKDDLLALRAFCLKIEIANEASEKNENRLRELKYAIGNNGRVSKVEASKFSSKAIAVQLVWKYFNSTGKCYKSVKPRDGGGTRYLKINENATKKELLESVKQPFCIKNKIKFGFVFNLKFEVATFSEERINGSIEIDGIQYPFTLKRCLDKYRMSTPKLFLLSKKKSFPEEALKNEGVNSDSDFELNETQDSADKYPEFGDNTHANPCIQIRDI